MQDMVSKWGAKVAARGFTQIPNYLVQLNVFVHEDHKLPPAEMVVLLQLVATWWKKDEMPFPSMSTIADRAGISERQVQRAIKSLVEKGYVVKAKHKIKGIIASNVYDLTPLVQNLQTVADHYINKHPREIKIRVERMDDGSFAVRKPGTERASGIAPTQAEAITLARELNPGATVEVERVMHTSKGKPDHWRSDTTLSSLGGPTKKRKAKAA